MEHQCEICDKVVLTIGALAKHMRVHTDGRKKTLVLLRGYNQKVNNCLVLPPPIQAQMERSVN